MMTTENLDKLFNPNSVAIVGATDRKGSIARTLTVNLVDGYEGEAYPVNPNKESVLEKDALPTVEDISENVDLAAIITPASTVPQIVDECGKAAIPAITIHSSGFSESSSEGERLEKEIEKKREEHGMRILGPNSLGVMRPSVNLNATISDKVPDRGETAFISQSGALGPSIVDQQAPTGVGFSSFVSVGNMLDIDFADLIDYFGKDPETRTILMHVESIRDPQKFLGAAKSFSKTKPIVLEKPGRRDESAEAVTSHIGSRPGSDPLYDALFRRSGVVRVDEISDLFYCSEALARKNLPEGPSLTIITNAGGPGIMATDTLFSRGGKLASLSDRTVEKLEKDLPPYASKTNPIDLASDANMEDYIGCMEACLEDDGVDGILVIYTPHGVISPGDLAETLADLSQKSHKPIFACWMGGETAQKGRDMLRREGVPTVNTPEQGVRIYMYMHEYLRNKELLYETPEPLSADGIPLKHQLEQRKKLKAKVEKVAGENRNVLMEEESKRSLQTYGIPTVRTHVAKTPEKAADLAEEIGFPTVLKVRSPDIVQKSEVGGVALNLGSKDEVKKAFNNVMESVESRRPEGEIRGVTLQRMIGDINCELTLRSKRHPRFGSTIMLRLGGVGGELYRDEAVGFPPLNQVHAQRLIERTKISDLLKELETEPSARIRSLQEYLARFSQLVIDFPEFKETNIELAEEKEGFSVVDAQIFLDGDGISYEDKPHAHLTVEPYPLKYIEKTELEDGREVIIRPIRPEDESSVFELFDTFSEETWRHRFFGSMKEIDHDDMIRFANVNYKREIALVGELPGDEKPKVIGMSRLVRERGKNTGEFAVAVGDPWQGLGLGTKLMESLLKVGRDKELKSIWGTVRKDNFPMRHLCRKLGFHIEKPRPETIKMVYEFVYEK